MKSASQQLVYFLFFFFAAAAKASRPPRRPAPPDNDQVPISYPPINSPDRVRPRLAGHRPNHNRVPRPVVHPPTVRRRLVDPVSNAAGHHCEGSPRGLGQVERDDIRLVARVDAQHEAAGRDDGPSHVALLEDEVLERAGQAGGLERGHIVGEARSPDQVDADDLYLREPIGKQDADQTVPAC